jgi:hypothetical protein
MELADATFFYRVPLRERTWQAVDDVRDVFGIHRLSFDDNTQAVHVEYDPSELTLGDLAALLRDTGLDIREKVWDE